MTSFKLEIIAMMAGAKGSGNDIWPGGKMHEMALNSAGPQSLTSKSYVGPKQQFLQNANNFPQQYNHKLSPSLNRSVPMKFRPYQLHCEGRQKEGNEFWLKSGKEKRIGRSGWMNRMK